MDANNEPHRADTTFISLRRNLQEAPSNACLAPLECLARCFLLMPQIDLDGVPEHLGMPRSGCISASKMRQA